jgi:hypothetical protein
MTANPTNAPSRKSTDRWENEGGPMAPPKTRGRDDVPVTLTAFDRGGPRYANAKDAIAAAKRPWRQA